MWIRQTVPLRRAAVRRQDAQWLRQKVAALAVPRHALRQAAENRRIADAISLEFESYGYQVIQQGEHRNIVAIPPDPGPYDMVCAHYDSVPLTPGADDNASALAVMLGAARSRPPSVAFVAFNREEDGMLGSEDFVSWLSDGQTLLSAVREVHVLEMVGYTDPRPGAQQVPSPIPKFLVPRDTGDFIALVGLGPGYAMAKRVHQAASGAIGVPPVVTLQAPLALLGWAPDLGRSDHLSFITKGIPAVMWTDTAEFRTPHYHMQTDAPDTLDYEFMAGVLKLLLATLDLREIVPPRSGDPR